MTDIKIGGMTIAEWRKDQEGLSVTKAFREALDLIESLAADRDELNEFLHAARAALSATSEDIAKFEIPALKSRVAELEAEVARLREALSLIQNRFGNPSSKDMTTKTARDALAAGEKETGE